MNIFFYFITLLILYAGNTGITPYSVPEIKTESNFRYKVYIDPEYTGRDSDGTINRPFSNFNLQFAGGVPSNTAFLFKRGTTHPKIGRQVEGGNSFYPDMLYYNNLIGAYGDGKRPVIEGIFIMAGSHHLTIRDLDIKAESQAGYDAVVYIHRTKNGEYIFCSNITIAFCEIAGVHNPGNYHDPAPYPFFGIRFYCDNFTIYNSIIRDTWQHGIIAERGTDFRAVRNWIYDVVHQDQRAQDEGWPTKNSNDPWSYEHNNSTSKAGWGNCIFVASYVNTTNHYIAGNLMDRSRYRWKACYITGAGWNAPYENLILEYNTFIAPKASDAGGVAVNWGAPKGSIFRNNVIDCSNRGTEETQFGFAGRWPTGRLQDHFSQEFPYGVYDNHWIRPHPGFSLTEGRDRLIPARNRIFNSWPAYQRFLLNNDPVGSDIDPEDFWHGRLY
ncbi:MAG: hypothetical protein ACFCUM_11520 [Bacteroidales bacterium]